MVVDNKSLIIKSKLMKTRKIQTESELQEINKKVTESYRKYVTRREKKRKRKPERAADLLNFQAGLKLLSPSISGKYCKKQHIQQSLRI